MKNYLLGKDPGAGKDCMQEEEGTTKDEMVGWHHHLIGRTDAEAEAPILWPPDAKS